MNLLLSLLLCIAMAVSGTAPLPAQSAEANEWIISNVTVGDGYEYITLDEQLVLGGSVCADEAMLRMQILSGDQVMLPAAMVLNGEALVLSFGSCKNAYSIKNDMIWELAEMTEEDALLFAQGEDLFMSLGSMLAKLRNREYAELLIARTEAADLQLPAQEKAAEAEIDGALYPAKHRSGEYSDADLMRALDSLDCTDLPELELLLDTLAQFACDLEGVDPEKGFAGLAERYAADADALNTTSFEELTAEAEGLSYAAGQSITRDAGGSILSTQSSEYISRPEGTRLRLQMSGTAETDYGEISGATPTDGPEKLQTTRMDAEIGITGPLDAPLSVEIDGEYSALTDYSFSTQKDGRETRFIQTYENRLAFDFGASKNAGLWAAVLNLREDIISDRGYESDRLREQESLEMKIGCTENRIGGETVRSIVIEIASGHDTLYLSFDLLHRKVAAADPMEGLTPMEIDLNGESMTPADLSLMSDVMSLSGSAMLLSAQEDVMTAGMLLDNFGYESYTEMESLDQAREYFDMPWPDYTPPAGYVLDSICNPDNSTDRIELYYWSEAEQEAMLLTYSDFRGRAPYSGLDEDALAKGPIVKTDVVDGLIYSIDVYTPQVHVNIATEGVRPEMMDSILQGLDIVPLYMDEAELAEYLESQKGRL